MYTLNLTLAFDEKPAGALVRRFGSPNLDLYAYASQRVPHRNTTLCKPVLQTSFCACATFARRSHTDSWQTNSQFRVTDCGIKSGKTFHKYHRVLSQARWSALTASRLLLQQLLAVFIGQQPLVVGIDETLERRWGGHIKARGIYRDAVRSSGSHFVKCSGLRWMCVMVLTKVRWANRIWALPFLTALAPSERYYEDKARVHKKLTDWARQLLLQVKRWVGERQVIAVGDSSYAVIDLLKALQGHVSLISRLRLDAALYEPVPQALPGQRGRKRLKGAPLAHPIQGCG